MLKDVINDIDLVLVMTVEPGFGGQGFMEDQVPKIKQVAEMIKKSGRQIDLEVDGGINPETAKVVIKSWRECFSCWFKRVQNQRLRRKY